MQWSYFKKGEQGRSIEDYAKILKLSNTILVPINTPSAQLIKSARLVCTIAGSSGWEAVNQLIPCIIFGPAWYEGAPGSLRVKNEAELRLAMKKIKEKKFQKWSFKDIDHFVNEVDCRSIFGVVDTLREQSDSDPIARIKNFSAAVLKFANVKFDMFDSEKISERKFKTDLIVQIEQLNKLQKLPRLLIYVEREAAAQEFAELALRLQEIGSLEVLFLASSKKMENILETNTMGLIPIVQTDKLFVKTNKRTKKIATNQITKTFSFFGFLRNAASLFYVLLFRRLIKFQVISLRDSSQRWSICESFFRRYLYIFSAVFFTR